MFRLWNFTLVQSYKYLSKVNENSTHNLGFQGRESWNNLEEDHMQVLKFKYNLYR